MPVTNTDAILWYNVGRFGQLGYAAPNFSDDVGSLNPNILDLVDLVGRNLFAIMHHEDADLTVPPSLNTIKRVHQLYKRFGTLIVSRAVPSNENNMEMGHVSPAGEVFKVFPIPYFLVRNKFLKRWAGLIMMMLAEAMQHSENRKTTEISETFAGTIGKYMVRLYGNMAKELYGKTREEVAVPGFILTEEEINSYRPEVFFTSLEMIDTVPNLGNVFTEDKLAIISTGVPVTSLPVMTPWPTNLTSYYNDLEGRTRTTGADDANVDDATAGTVASPGGGPIIPSPPGA